MTFLVGAVMGLIGTQALDHFVQLRRGSQSDGGLVCMGVASLSFLGIVLAAVQGSRGARGLPAWVALVCGLLGGPVPLIIFRVADVVSG
jgi:hypothetical protein